MKEPSFISPAPSILPNWKQAFPGAFFYTGLPAQFSEFDDSLIFLDCMNLGSEEKQRWLDTCLKTQRQVFVLSLTPNLHEAIQVIRQGAVGYGHTLSTPDLLREMVLVVSHGGVWIGNKLMKRVMAALHPTRRADQPPPASNAMERFQTLLSHRELAVGEMVAIGATNAEISAQLNIKERTVKAHVTSLFDKLSVRNRVELSLVLNGIRVSRPPNLPQ